MNKTVNINLGGIFFHMDEDAYQKINRYFEAVKRSLAGDSGTDEIMNDIEARIAEIFSERIQTSSHVVTLKDVDAMITVMGQPEDYHIDNENQTNSSSTSNTKYRGKKLFRDMDNKILGGVCAGFGHYTGIDALWIRLALVLITISGFGSPILIYILLWVLVPKAISTAEKLAMTGEPANLSNIERKVREERDNQDIDKKKDESDQRLSDTSTNRSFGSSVGNAISLLFSIFGKIIGFFILFISIPMLFALVIGLFATIFGVATIMSYPAWDYVNAVMYEGFPLWVVSILAFIALGVPIFYFMVLGLKLLITNMRSLGNPFNYTLLALWIISLALLVIFGAKQVKEYAYDSKVVEKLPLNLNLNDTLKISFANNEFYYKDTNRRTDFEIKENEQGQPIVFSNSIRFEVLSSKEDYNYIIIEKEAKGSTLEKSKKRAELIKYAYKIENNQLVFDNYLTTDLKNRYRGQEVKIYLYLKPNTILKANQSIRNYEVENRLHGLWQDDNEQTYMMLQNDIKCLTCKQESGWNEDYTEDIDTINEDTINTISLKINDKEIINAEPKKGRLVIDKNGIVKKP
jgi:phage shock protein PspC (stress-responsive transcriptional regulator)